MTDRRKIENPPPALQEYERFRDQASMLERFLLGCAIQDRSGYTAADIVVAFKDGDFVDPLHRAVFRAIRALLSRGARDLDVGMVIAELQRQGTFAEFPNATSYVCSLTEGVVPSPTRESRILRLQEMAFAWSESDRAKREVAERA